MPTMTTGEPDDRDPFLGDLIRGWNPPQADEIPDGECESAIDHYGRVHPERRCHIAHPRDLSKHCHECAWAYIQSLDAGHDYLGGTDEHGRYVSGFSDPLSLHLIAAGIIAIEDARREPGIDHCGLTGEEVRASVLTAMAEAQAKYRATFTSRLAWGHDARHSDLGFPGLGWEIN